MARQAALATLTVLLLLPAGCDSPQAREKAGIRRAKESVCRFEGDRSLRIGQVLERSEYDKDESPPVRRYRVSVERDGRPYADFAVDASREEVTEANYYFTKYVAPTAKPQGPRTRDECRKLARTYVRARYKGFGSMGFRLSRQVWNRRTWGFVWEQILPGGAISPNYVSVDVSPADGRVRGYASARFEVQAPPPPKITAKEALAKANLGMNTRVDKFATDPTPALRIDPEGNAFWRIEKQGSSSSECYRSDVEIVDAQTGKQRSWSTIGRMIRDVRAIITQAQACDAIRSFEVNPTLQSRCRPVEPGHGHSKEVYTIEPVGKSLPRWTVDAATGEILEAWYRLNGTDRISLDPPGPMVRDQCIRTARDYARARYHGFDEMGFVLEKQDWRGTEWQFVWRQKTAYGAWTRNRVQVRTDPGGECILDYSACRIPSAVPYGPRMTAKQAIAWIKRHGDYKGTVCTNVQLWADPGKSWWTFDLKGVGKSEGKLYRAKVEVGPEGVSMSYVTPADLLRDP